MGIFRKKETYNEQMLREAGLDRVVFNTPEPAPEGEPTASPPWIDRHPRANLGGPAAWDYVTTVVAPGIDGDNVSFTILPSGDLIVTSEEGDGDLAPLADAIEEHVSPPYKAIAARQEGNLWGVGGARIEVETFPFPGANALELARSDGRLEFDVDDEPSDATPPETLQRLGERAGADFCVQASRIDGDYWEVMVSTL